MRHLSLKEFVRKVKRKSLVLLKINKKITRMMLCLLMAGLFFTLYWLASFSFTIPTPVKSTGGATAALDDIAALSPTSIASLRSLCRTHAPSLYPSDGSDVWGGDTVVPGEKNFDNVIIRQPVCFHYRDNVFGRAQILVDVSSPGDRIPRRTIHYFSLKTPSEVSPLTDAFFKSHNGTVKLVPAIAAVAWGRYIANHAYHTLAEIVPEYFTWATRYRDGLLLKLPLQTVLIDGQTKQWGKSAASHSMVKDVVNILSHRAGGAAEPPFEETAPFYLFRDKKRANYAQLYINGKLKPSGPACYCQGMSMRNYKRWKTSQIATGFRMAADLAPRQFLDIEAARMVRDGEPGATGGGEGGRWPLWANAYWRENKAVVGYQPKIVFFRRRNRVVGHEEEYIRYARDTLHYRVEAVYPEDLSNAQQYYIAATCDVMAGSHGLALAHSVWMATSQQAALPAECRKHLIEFMHWADPTWISEYQRFTNFTGINYHRLSPIDVVFGPSVMNATLEKELIHQPGASWRVAVFKRPSWHDQTSIHNRTEVEQTLLRLHKQIKGCYSP